MKSRFFAGSSSDSDKNESDQDLDNDNQITQRQAGGRFGATFQESDSGTISRIWCNLLIPNRTFNLIT